MSEIKANTRAALDQLEEQVRSFVQPMGYEVVALEQSTGPARSGRVLTLYIDFPMGAANSAHELSEESPARIGLEDCIKVNDALNELFETTPLLEGAYTLEVSSPGVERPLRKPRDYARFAGQKVRVHTFRPLVETESENVPYWKKNQKQKNFVGILKGLNAGQSKIQMEIDGNLVAVPLEVVSKAHLEFVAPKGYSK